MKYIIMIILRFTSLSCEKGKIIQSSKSKEYIFDYAKEDSISDDVSNFYGIQSFQLENFLSPISREQYKKDSLKFKNEYIIKEYSYSGFSNLLNSHIIKISLYDNDLYLLLKNNKYEYLFLQSEPIISSDKTKTLTFKNSDVLNSTLSIYNVKDKNLNIEKTIW